MDPLLTRIDILSIRSGWHCATAPHSGDSSSA
jgi:hypothetical protein